MSAKEIDELRRTIARRFRECAAGTFFGTVTAVDEKARICTIEAEGVSYDGVMLFAVEDAGRPGWCVIPAAKSVVLVSRLAGSNQLYVSMFSEVDKVVLTIRDKVAATLDADGMVLKSDNTTMQATVDGLVLTRGSSGLKKTLSDLLDAIAQLTVSTAVGPSSVPINVAQFQQIKADLDNYLKE